MDSRLAKEVFSFIKNCAIFCCLGLDNDVKTTYQSYDLLLVQQLKVGNLMVV